MTIKNSDISALIEQTDWSATPIGHPAGWPVRLRTIFQIMQESKSPMFLAWEGETFLYNAPYATFLADKHPAAFGRRMSEVWSEIWPHISPLVARAMAGDAIHMEDMALMTLRQDRLEQNWYSFSYTPVRDDHGGVCGLYGVVENTTQRVLELRRQAVRISVSEELRVLSDSHEIMCAGCRLLGQSLGANRVVYGEFSGNAERFNVLRSWTLENSPLPNSTGESHAVHPFGPVIANVLRLGMTLTNTDINSDPRTAPYADAYAAIGIRAQLAVPILNGRKLSASFVMHHATPRDWSEVDVEMAEYIAHQTADALKRSRAEEALRDETRILALLNKTGESVSSTLDLQTLLQAITDQATQISGAKFGAFFYHGTDEQGEAMMLYCLSGAPREAFEQFGKPRATPLFATTMTDKSVVRVDDILRDARYGREAPHHGMPPGHLPVRSYLAVPVISRSGESVGTLLFGHPDVGMFSERTERIIVSIAAQAAAAVDNARLYAAAQKATAQERLARDEAERLNRMQSEFLAMLAHELRNPLAPISSGTEMIQQICMEEEKVQRIAAIINRQVRHMTRLVDDLLDVSRVTRGLITLERATVDLREAVTGAIDQTRSLIEQKKHCLQIEMPPEPVYIDGDYTRMVQTLTNIINNAVKYTGEGGTITVSLQVQEGRKAIITVTDNGAGMTTELIPDVFCLFTQGKRTLDRAEGGLGLGLALVKKLVELHGGKVVARSAGPGQGSQFELCLPLLDPLLVQDISTAPLPVPAELKQQSFHVMVIDDNVDAADTLTALLEVHGHEVTAAYTASAALEKIALHAPQVVMIDIGLPDMNGYELARRLREHPQMQHALLIAVTGYGQINDRVRSSEAGFDHHLVKPVHLSSLTAILAKIKPQSTVPA